MIEFEVRTLHRGRTSFLICLRNRSFVKIEPVRVNPAHVAVPDRHSLTIEEFQDFDRHLSSIVDTVAEETCGKFAPLGIGRDLPDDRDHFRCRLTGEEMVMPNLVDTAEPCTKFEDAAYLSLVDAQRFGEIADSRRTESPLAFQMWKDSGIEFLLLFAQPDLVARQSDEGAFEHQAPRRLFGPKRNQKGRRRQSWRDLQPKALATDPLQIGVLHMKGAQYALDLVGKCGSLALRQRMTHRRAFDDLGRGRPDRVLQFRLR